MGTDLSLAVDLSPLKSTSDTSESLTPSLDDVLDQLPTTPAQWTESLREAVALIHEEKVTAQTGLLKDDQGFVYEFAIALIGRDSFWDQQAQPA